MSIRLSSLILVLSVNFYGCQDEALIPEATGDMLLKIVGNYGDNLLLMNDTYNYQNDLNLKFERFAFFISDVTLVKEQSPFSDLTELFELEYVDLSYDQNNIENAKVGWSKVARVPVGEYSGIKLGIGLPADVNRTNPTDDENLGHPLGNPTNYMPDWESYIFTKIEGTADFDNNGAFMPEEQFNYHVGANSSYRVFTIPATISIQENEIREICLNVDLQDIFISSIGDALDIEAYRAISSPDETELLEFLSNNFTTAIDMK